MKLFIVAFVLSSSFVVQYASAGPATTCSIQSECLGVSVQSTSDGASCNTSGACMYQICINESNGSGGCVKDGSWSHMCDAADDSLCPRNNDGTANFWDSSPAPAPEGFEMCQYVSAGETATFLLKDGSGCAASPASTDFTFGDVTATCSPSKNGVSRFPSPSRRQLAKNGNSNSDTTADTTTDSGGGGGEKTCSGNGEGVECIWTITAPSGCPNNAPDPTASPVADPTASPVVDPTAAPVTVPVSVNIEKTVHLDDIATCFNGQEIEYGVDGQVVTYCYEVTNTGDVELSVDVTDGPVGTSETLTSLVPGAVQFVRKLSSITRDLTSPGVADGTPNNGGDPVTDSDPAGVEKIPARECE